jgi:glycosyltransferase involved in cell wall biosynthesis
MAALSVITPTLGRESLEAMFRSLLPQLSEDDEVLVVGDGHRPRAREICAAQSFKKIVYYEVPFTGNWGNPGRNDAISKAKGTHLFFIDDDDLAMPGAVGAMRKGADANPGRPLMFKMHHRSIVIYGPRAVTCGNVSGQMFVPPNVPGRVGRWSGRYMADFDFVNHTLSLYPKGHAEIVWLGAITTRQGQVGPGNGRALP